MIYVYMILFGILTYYTEDIILSFVIVVSIFVLIRLQGFWVNYKSKFRFKEFVCKDYFFICGLGLAAKRL